MDEKEAREAGVPLGKSIETPALLCCLAKLEASGVLLHNWYDAALYFLYQADFLRRHDLKSVQAIAILGIVFNNVGDSELHSVMWSSAIRIAQSLRLDQDDANIDETFAATQLRRRLWWTLVLCEWLPVPYHTPCIVEADFHVALPSVLDDEELYLVGVTWEERPRPIQYHLVMIQLAQLFHRFRTRLHSVLHDAIQLGSFVLNTDESLAQIIESLPTHLRHEQQEDGSTSSLEIVKPWIAWQRVNLSLALLYHRIVINRVLQNQWVQDPETFARTRAICLGSAKGIISLTEECFTDLAKHRPW